MRASAGKTLLLLLLLAIAGQALAAPCAGEARPAMAMAAEDGHGGHCSAEAGEHPCEPDSGCEQTCSCCPSHCAGALPSGSSQMATALRGTPVTAYAEIHSSPEPETAIRPPIPR